MELSKNSDTFIRSSNLAEAAIIFVYACLAIFILPHHVPWRDETDVWVAVKDLSVGDLFGWYLRSTGHPGLWHMILMPFAKAGLPISAMYIIHGVIGVLMVTVFVRFSPFSLLTKALWVFSMPIAYEYTVIARNYSITALMLFIVAALYSRRFEKPFVYACAVFLLMQTHALVFMTGCALTLCYGLELWEKRSVVLRTQTLAWVLMGIGILATICELMPLSNQAIETILSHTHAAFSIRRLMLVLGGAWMSSPYHPSLQFYHNITSDSDLLFLHIFLYFLLFHGSLWFVLPPLIFFLTFCVMRGKLYPSIIFLLSISWFFYVDFFKYSELTLRHFVLIEVETFFTLWIARTYPDISTISPQKIKRKLMESTNQKTLMTLINICLLYTCILTPFYYYREYYEPFSASKGVATFLKREHLENHILVTDILFSIVPLLDDTACVWPSYISRCQRVVQWNDAAYWKYFYEETDMASAGLEEGKGTMGGVGIRRAMEKFKDLSGKVFITVRPLSSQEIKQYKLVLVYREAATGDEWAWVYIPEKDLRDMKDGQKLNNQGEGR